MKRLIRAKKYIFKQSGLIKKADWKDVNVYQNDIINIITDAMTQQSVIKINYENSGWRNILPYGWYTSKDNNILLYCYKENSAIRSYRVDRIINLMIDDKLETAINKKEEETNPMDFEILELPENNEEILELSENEQGAETPFDESLEILENSFNDVDNNQNDISIQEEPENNNINNEFQDDNLNNIDDVQNDDLEHFDAI